MTTDSVPKRYPILPPQFVIGPQGDGQLLDYRFRSPYYVLDRLFDAAEVRLDLNRAQVVRVERTDGVAGDFHPKLTHCQVNSWWHLTSKLLTELPMREVDMTDTGYPLLLRVNAMLYSRWPSAE
jgi:hypothetical protein